MAEVCPFCGYKGKDGYAIQLHIEEHHTLGSPFVAEDHGPSKRPRIDTPYHEEADASIPRVTRCTRPDCGKDVRLENIDDHLEMHAAIDAVRNEEREFDYHVSCSSASNCSNSLNTGTKKYFSDQIPITLRNAIKDNSFQRKPTGRLGTKELGPHAFEKQMPSKVRRALENDSKPRVENQISCSTGKIIREQVIENETSNIIPILADLCSLDPNSSTTYLCHPSVRHVRKLYCEGNFCGYWNIQMLLTYLHAISNPDLAIPNVLQIQETIERAWDNGICTYGRTETGGVRGTRKWIGTHEAAAFFLQTNTPVSALSFGGEADAQTPNPKQPAHISLLDYVEAYYISGREAREVRVVRNGFSTQLRDLENPKAHITQLPPIYFQRAGHSMTIVGLERMADNTRNLLLFDPSFETTNAMRRLVKGHTAHARPETLLQPYRKSERKLAAWDEFEVLMPSATTNGKAGA